MRKRLIILILMLVSGISSIASASLNDAERGVVEYWKFDNNYNNSANYSNYLINSSSDFGEFVPFIVNDGYNVPYAGINPSNMSLKSVNIEKDKNIKTMDIWFKRNASMPSPNNVFVAGYSHTTIDYRWVFFSSGNQIYCQHKQEGSECSSAVSTNQHLFIPQHLICSINGSHIKLYVNGSLIDEDTCSHQMLFNTTYYNDFYVMDTIGSTADLFGTVDNIFISTYYYDSETALQSYNSGDGTEFNLPYLNFTLQNLILPNGSVHSLNNQIYEYKKGDYNITYVYENDNPVNYFNVSIFDNESVLKSQEDNQLFNIFFNSDLLLNRNPLKIVVNISSIDNESQTVTQYWNITDSIMPYCNLSNYTTEIEEFYNFTIKCYDESFNSINISCENRYNYSDYGMDVINYEVNGTVYIDANITCNIDYSDKFSNYNNESFYIFYAPVPPPPPKNYTVLGIGTGSNISAFNLSELFFIFLIVIILCFMLIVSLWMRVAGAVIICSVLFLFFGLFIQWSGLPRWVSITGYGLICWAIMIMVVGIFMGRK